MFYQINFIGAMTCDDDALLKDGAIQKEMKLEIKPAFCDFEALFKMFIEPCWSGSVGWSIIQYIRRCQVRFPIQDTYPG